LAANSSHLAKPLEIVPSPTVEERLEQLERQMEGLADFVAQLWRGGGSLVWDRDYNWDGGIPRGAWAVTNADGSVEHY
jgi:hypothetical protein